MILYLLKMGFRQETLALLSNENLRKLAGEYLQK